LSKNKIIAEDLKQIVSIDLPWSNFAEKTVLITGANGFLPSYLVETLLYLDQNTKIIALVRSEEKALNRFIDYSNNKNLEFIVQDVSKPIEIEQELHYIIHAASQASPKYFGSDPVGTMLPNIIGTYNLLELAKLKKVNKFLYFSSCEIYGDVGEGFDKISEDNFGIVNPNNIRSSYSESKRAGETLCVSYHYQCNVPVVIVRPFHTYGPKLAQGDGRVFADFVFNIVNNQDIVMYSDGSAERSFCYATDATRGFFTLLLLGKEGEAYNLANPSCESSIINLATTLVNLFPEKKLKVKKSETAKENYLPSTINRLRPDITKMNNLGWFPSISIEDGFKRTILSFDY
jgi:UDP-glucuronate decarboxylase